MQAPIFGPSAARPGPLAAASMSPRAARHTARVAPLTLEPGRAGKPFVVGERFQGCFGLAQGIAARVPAPLRPLARAVLAAARGLTTFVEDVFLSDYAEIVGIELAPAPGAPYRLEYRYLD